MSRSRSHGRSAVTEARAMRHSRRLSRSMRTVGLLRSQKSTRCVAMPRRPSSGSIGPGALAMRVSRASSTTPSSCATRTIRALQLCRKVGLPVPERRGSGRDLYTRRAGAARAGDPAGYGGFPYRRRLGVRFGQVEGHTAMTALADSGRMPVSTLVPKPGSPSVT